MGRVGPDRARQVIQVGKGDKAWPMVKWVSRIGLTITFRREYTAHSPYPAHIQSLDYTHSLRSPLATGSTAPPKEAMARRPADARIGARSPPLYHVVSFLRCTGDPLFQAWWETVRHGHRTYMEESDRRRMTKSTVTVAKGLQMY